MTKSLTLILTLFLCSALNNFDRRAVPVPSFSTNIAIVLLINHAKKNGQFFFTLLIYVQCVLKDQFRRPEQIC